MMKRIQGLPPISRQDAHTLILGSMPSARSLQANEYYAHSGNAFWGVMGDLIDAGRDKVYSERLHKLHEKGISVWDVIRFCVRPGSNDVDIRDEEPNDFLAFFKAHPQIKKIGLNGTKAAKCFQQIPKEHYSPQISIQTLPSTSGANTRLSFREKRDAWRAFLLV